jgi:hypothetical protein
MQIAPKFPAHDRDSRGFLPKAKKRRFQTAAMIAIQKFTSSAASGGRA